MIIKFVDALLELPINGEAATTVTVQSAAQSLAQAGLFGVVDEHDANDRHVHVRLLTRADEENSNEHADLVVRAVNQPIGECGFVSDVEGYLAKVADHGGFRIQLFQAHSDDYVEIASSLPDHLFSYDNADVEADSEAVDSNTGESDAVDSNTGESDAVDSDGTDSVEDQSTTLRALYAMYGKEFMASKGSLKQDNRMLANELSRDVKAAVTVVSGARATGAFCVEETEEGPTWVGRRPVVEIYHSEHTMIRWFSKTPREKGLIAKLASSATPRNVWFIEDPAHAASNENSLPHFVLQTSNGVESDAFADISADVISQTYELGLPTITLEAAEEAQQSLLDFAMSEAEDDVDSVDDARALAEEIGLEGHKAEELVTVLTSSEPRTIHEIINALGLEPEWAQALTTVGNPQELAGAVHVDTPSVKEELGLANLIERPTEPGLVNAMRRLDFDRPALALAMEIFMVLAAAALVIAGVMGIGVFAHLWVAIVGYVVAAWLALDGVASIIVWTKIRRLNR